MRINRGTFKAVRDGLAVMILIAVSAVSSAASFSNQTVVYVSSATATQDCFYFTLFGVSQPDPSCAGPWLAVPASHPGAKQIVAIVLAAKTAEKPITVYTTTQSACGFVMVELRFHALTLGSRKGGSL